MELSKQTQTIIALISGVVLGALLVFMFMQHYYEGRQQSSTNSAQTQQQAPDVAEQPAEPAPDTAAPVAQETKTPAETTETPAPAQQAQDTPATTNPATTAAPTPTTNATASYTYTARPGDSYTVLARKAIQTYGLIHHVNLTPAQIVAAEALLTAQAGSPELNEGQQVVMDSNGVQSAIDSAQKLSPGELAEWDAYAQDVNFNTNNNG